MNLPSCPKVLWVLSGSIAAYKVPECIRRLTQHNIQVTCVMTEKAGHFVTPMTLATISGNPVYTELFDLESEIEMGHIRLSRNADIVIVAPASANMIAKMAHGMTDNLATTLLLATNKPVFVAPAMNVCMWEHPATQRNIAQLQADGITILGPSTGDLACGESGLGRMLDIEVLTQEILSFFASK